MHAYSTHFLHTKTLSQNLSALISLTGSPSSGVSPSPNDRQPEREREEHRQGKDERPNLMILYTQTNTGIVTVKYATKASNSNVLTAHNLCIIIVYGIKNSSHSHQWYY